MAPSATYFEESSAADSKDVASQTLSITDNRTGQKYTVPIVHNAISAKEFKKIKTVSEDPTNPADQTQNGLRLYDPGFNNTAVAESKITYVDGSKGIIQYRGYSISDLVGKVRFEDTFFLLVWGHLPSLEERRNFVDELHQVPLPDQSVFDTIRALPPSSPPVTMIIAGLVALQASQAKFIPAMAAENLYLGNMKNVDRAVKRFIVDFAAINAIVYCHHTGREFTPPRDDLSYVENLMLMMGHVEPSTGLPNPLHVDRIERLWTLVADHEMTCSTAALLGTASSLPDFISCQISAISAGYGILHAGAIEVAYKAFHSIGSVENCAKKMESFKSGKERLFGYGHRIYKVVDPRSVYIREILDELHDEVSKDPVLSVAMELNRLASTDPYFVSRKLHANADLFASFAYKAIGFPTDFILPLSIMSRTQGGMAHWREAMSQPPSIWRPMQLYTGNLNKSMPTGEQRSTDLDGAEPRATEWGIAY